MKPDHPDVSLQERSIEFRCLPQQKIDGPKYKTPKVKSDRMIRNLLDCCLYLFKPDVIAVFKYLKKDNSMMRANLLCDTFFESPCKGTFHFI